MTKHHALILLLFLPVFFSELSQASVSVKQSQDVIWPKKDSVLQTDLEILRGKLITKANKAKHHDASLIFDIPVTYNRRVAYWLQFFQTKGHVWFREWLEKSTKYMPFIQKELRQAGLPGDLAFMVMIESGFDPYAQSHASAVGPWQFIKPTAVRYGLNVNWWIDERRDFKKSTLAAIRYMRDLYAEFGSWYLVAASFNMGENGLRRQMQKSGSRDFWQLSQVGALPQETVDYVPKIIAAMLIAKAPSLYGFRELARMEPLEYDMAILNGGTDLNRLADHLGITRKALRDLNAELLLGSVPIQVEKHYVRVPRGSQQMIMSFLQGTRAAQN